MCTRGGKLIHYHGTSDGLILYQGSVQHYERVVARMGGHAVIESFYRLYVIPAIGHGAFDGTSGLTANPPVPAPLRGEIYRLLTDWVEKGIAPENVVLHSASETPAAKSLPMCAYPRKVTYLGGGTTMAASYACR